MQRKIEKICVIGAGVMGSGIAGLIASAGCSVLLLDMASEEAAKPSSITEKALERIKDSKSQLVTHPDKVKNIICGNLRDDLSKISDCDLIIEAIVEKLEIKSELYAKISPYLNGGAVLASNTSTIPLATLKRAIPENLKTRFMILHFFNPPRFMDLLELVTDIQTDSGHINRAVEFIENSLGKSVIQCNDTPGFIANRVGCFFLELVVRRGVSQNLNPVLIDKILCKLFKMPSTRAFGLYDLIGHDVVKLISESLIKTLDSNDKYTEIYIQNDLQAKMLELGLNGRKVGRGFYRLNDQKMKEVIDFRSLSYLPISESDSDLPFKDLNQLFTDSGIYAQFFREIMCIFYAYILNLVPSAARSFEDIDQTMKLGYGWKYGPLEMLSLHKILLKALEGSKEYFIAERVLDAIRISKERKLIDYQKEYESIFSNASAELYRYKGRLIFSINTKMNCLNKEVFDLLLDSIDYAESNLVDLYIYSNSLNFSAGADLSYITENLQEDRLDQIRSFIELGQKAVMRMKYAKINVVSCASGVALGGGCELLLHSSMLIAHSNLNAGLVELKVGLVPGWGGIKEMLIRSEGDTDKLIKTVSNIILSNKSSSADYFIDNYYIQNYKVVPNKYKMLQYLCDVELPKKTHNEPDIVKIPSIKLDRYLNLNHCDDFQKHVLYEVQKIIDFGDAYEYDLLKSEREIFMNLVKGVKF